MMYVVELTAAALRDAEVGCHREHGVVYSMIDDDRPLFRRDGRRVILRCDSEPSGAVIRSMAHVDSPTATMGQVLRGMLRASPTVCKSRAGRRGKVLPITDRDGVEAWFRRKLLDAGLIVIDIDIEVEKPAIGHKPGGRRITHNRADARFRCEVADPDALKAALRDGIGRGKAYGHGLLLVLPCRS